ncbi:MAG: hypothetical protein NC037_00280 [Bacteroides sp.]|nr:hypothetical protein [Bacillota bacterium]MCM1393745.1 hypothetical protein [[Eubacterium] siraeum]MCM1454954.1 hypothetical protein [Bacteroides sp.]
MRKSKSVIKFIGLLLVFVIVAVCLVIIFRFTNGLNEDFKMFYLNYGEERIVSEHNEMQFNLNNDYRFDVSNTFGSLQGDVVFDVSVRPNGDVDFEYSVNGEKKLWSESKLDFTKYFVTDKGKDSFTLSINVNSMDELMSLVYPDATVVLPSKLDASIYPLDAVITSNGSNTVYHIKFCFADFITIDPPNTVF